MALNERQRRFCELYAADPNATAAAVAAGYNKKTARAQGARLLTKADIWQYIRHLQEELAAARIASVAQIQAYWTGVMGDCSERTADRLKASELLARAAGAFLPPEPEHESFENNVVIYLPKMLTEEQCLYKENAADDE